MWYNERIGKRRKAVEPVFTMCCMQGKVILPLLKDPPQELIDLLCKGDELSRHFREFIRAYNMMFSFTSLGGKIVHSVNNGTGPYVFQMNGENYHRIGDMIPKPGELPKFAQLYIYDTMNEVANRIKAYSSTRGGGEKLDEKIVALLKQMLDECNPHVKAFRTAKERFNVNGQTSMKLRLISNRTSDPRTHNIPTCQEVAALVPGDFVPNMQARDIILETRSGKMQRISELHPAYLPLQYPLLFVYGEDGFMLKIPISEEKQTTAKRKSVTLREFLAFRFLERDGEAPTITRSGRLFQQIAVDGYTMIESSRLRFVWNNKKKLRSSTYEAIKKASADGGAKLSRQGRIFIPASFTGGPRFLNQHYLDAMTICQTFGYPDLFITFTCNPKWPEVTRYLKERNLTTEDRPDIMCRVFKMKLDNLMAELTKKKGGPFGCAVVGKKN